MKHLLLQISVINDHPFMVKVKQTLTRVWLTLIFVFIAYTLIKQPDIIMQIFNRISAVNASLALFLIVVGKIFTIALVFFSLKAHGEKRSVCFTWRAYSVADIAKYLPGGIWSIAGRLTIYKNDGIAIGQGSRILLSETALIILASFFTGLVAVSFVFGGLAIVVTVILFTLAFLVTVRICLPQSSNAERWGIACILVLSWMSFGISFAVICLPVTWEWLFLAGQFNISFAVGQLVVFAPSGMGVREVVVGLLSRHDVPLSMQDIIELAVFHRLIWLVADILVLAPLGFISSRGEK